MVISTKGVVRSFHQKDWKEIFFVIEIYQAQNFTLALLLHEKNKKNRSNIENLGSTHFVPSKI